MFCWVLNMLFLCNTNQLTSFYLIQFFMEVFSKQAIQIWILIPIIPQNMVKFHSKKSTLNMTKLASLKKIHMKIIIMKRNIELNDLGFLCYSAKACPNLSRFM